MWQVRRIGDDAIAHAERALGRFDNAVNVVEALGLGDAQPIEHAEDHQRGEPLRRRRRVEQRAGFDRDRERLGEHGAAGCEIGARHRAADAFEVGGDLAADIAAVEVVEPGIGQMFERAAERLLAQHLAGRGRLAVDEKGRRETRDVVRVRQACPW